MFKKFLNALKFWKWGKSESKPAPKPTKPKEDKQLIRKLAETYSQMEIEFPNLKAVTLAQWILESGRGTSKLSSKHFNFAGLKMRPEMKEIGVTGVKYMAHDGEDEYCAFKDLEHFIRGYWRFIKRHPYVGYEEYANDPMGYIKHIRKAGYAEDPKYNMKIESLIPEAEMLLEEMAGDERRDNEEPEVDLPVDTPEVDDVEWEDEAGELWYPNRMIHEKTEGLKMKTRGSYKYGYPEGLVVHFTAGRSRGGAKRNRATNLEQGIQSVRSAVDKGSYAYFVIDRDGNVFQNFPLNKWGYHAGKSSWHTVSGTVSNNFTGVEIQNAGKLDKASGGKFKAWFTSSKDSLFEPEEVRTVKKEANRQAGHYHKYSPEQEAALENLIEWLYVNSPKKSGKKVFSLDNVVGHDEVSPGRKSDPGGSLSMTMPEFRSKLKEELV